MSNYRMQQAGRYAFPALLASIVLIGLVPFQNCGGGFKSTDKPFSPVLPGPSDGEQIAPPSKTRFYFGRSGGIDAIELNQGNGAVTILPSVAFAGTQAGWLSYDKLSNTMFAADAGTLAKLELFSLAANSGRLTSTSVKDYVPGIVHLTAIPSSGAFHFFASNYNAGTASYHVMTNGTLNAGQTVSFGATAKAHSSAYDPSRQLVFVATLGLNKIQVFKLNGTTIAPAGEISVDSPRTVVFDTRFDKLYVSTEAYSGTSFIKGYSIVAAGAAYTFTEIASMPMSQIGADLKINHAHRYVMATSRENGRQAINGMPVNPDGTLDNSRAGFAIPLTQVQPRSLEVTSDGDYVIVAMNSSTAENVLAFKMTFDAQSQFTGSTQIFAQKIGTEGYACAASVPVE